MPEDWFAQNAPQQTPQEADWFATNAPGAGGSWEPESAPMRFAKGAAKQLDTLLKNPYGLNQPELPPVDVNNPPKLQWDMPKSLSEFAGRAFGPSWEEIKQFGKGLVDYEDIAKGNYAGAAGQIATNVAAMAGAKTAATEGIARPVTAPENPYSVPRAVAGAEKTYSKPGNALASQLPSVSGADMPAVAHTALPLVREAAADLGLSEAAFSRLGRMNGPAYLKAAVNHAVDLQNQRVEPLLDVIRPRQVAPFLLENNPELASQLDLTKPVTYDMVDQVRKDANAQLTRGNYYLKPVSKQIAANEPTIDALKTAQQARLLLYKEAGDATGIDLRPLQAAESNLITLNDAVNQAHNSISRAEAIYNTSPLYQKLPIARVLLGGRGASAYLSESAIKAGQTLPPTFEFNRAMQRVFKGLEPARANVTIPFTLQEEPIPQFGLQLPPRTNITPEPQYPALPPGGRPSDYFPQMNIEGTPYIPREGAPLRLGIGTPPHYVEPTVLPPERLLQRKGVPATRNVKPLSIEETR